MKTKHSATVRRSVALPKDLIDEVQTVAPVELRDNLNRLVIIALQDFAAKQKAHAFAEAMAQMAADDQLQEEFHAINEEFVVADEDGLADDATR
ncbi:MAG: hypothetical protein HYX67_04310 [Candidatus Melainabacteria bacterium]|nr:hypothetical protein [Candidatus Melainabacteria bacterium]